MTWEGTLTTSIVVVMLIALASGYFATEVIIWGCLAVLITAGFLTGSPHLPTPEQAVAGLGNSSLVTVALLLVVVEGLMRTRATDRISQPLLKLQSLKIGILAPLLLVVGLSSALLNNTAIVAIFLPIVHSLCQRTGISPSRMYLPMCYTATLGGVCSMIGTSTNMVVDGLMRDAKLTRIPLFEIAWVGIPILIAGTIYLVWASRFLKNKKPAISLADDPRDYVVEMTVDMDGPLVNKSIEDAGLRHLQGLFLAEIHRGDEVIVTVPPHERLDGGDILVFVGIVDSVVDLRKVKGLSPSPDTHFDFKARPDRCLMEVVVSPQNPSLNQTIRDSNFRSVYESTVLAVAQDGKRIRGKIGDHVLEAGDTLLLETHPDFVEQHRLSKQFYIVSQVENSSYSERELERSGLALFIVSVLIGLVAFEMMDMLLAALLGSLAMLALGCCTIQQARASIDMSLLLTIGGAFGIAKALETSGAAEYLSLELVKLAGNSPWWTLAAVYFATLVSTELVTNNAAAAIMFPIALQTANSIDASPTPFLIAIMIAASCGFATPFGYQTNLMVAGPGGYRFMDYVKLGLPLDLICFAVAMLIIPQVWPF